MTELFANPILGTLSPGLIVILGALLVPILPGVIRSAWMLALPVIATIQLLGLDGAETGRFVIEGLELTTVHADPLGRTFALIFLLATFLALIYALHVRSWVEQVAGLVYAGSAIGAVLAGDLVTLFLFWEGTALASVFLIWANRGENALDAGQRYLVMQVGSGVLLLAGAMLHYAEGSGIGFTTLDLDRTSGVLIFLAFGIKAAFPLLHTWLPDAYPRATPTGAVWLSAFTTKLAIYALARGFAGTEILVPIGLVMAVFPLIQAAAETDLRKVLAQSLNSGLGFMVVGVGIGSELALAGVAGHALSHVLYNALLFMAMGAVVHRLGTARADQLGGLARSMPATAAMCALGALAMSTPLFTGFVTKSLILSAVSKEGDLAAWLILVAVGAGSFFVAGLKVTWFAFFGRESGQRPAEAPANMLAAMGLSAAVAVIIGCAPSSLYAMLPYTVEYHVYSASHILTQLQLLVFTTLVFGLVVWSGRYTAAGMRDVPDVDWLWRGPVKRASGGAVRGLLTGWDRFAERSYRAAVGAARGVYRTHGPNGVLARTRPTNAMAFWMALLLVLFLLLSFF